MMNVAYDVTALARSPHGGIAQVCRHTALQAVGHPAVSADAWYRGRLTTDHDSTGLPPLRQQQVFLRFFGRGYDIAHGLCHRMPALKAKMYVYTVHDVWSLYPNEYQPPGFQEKVGKRMMREIAAADFVITDSDATRRSLLDLGLIPETKCATVHLGVSLPELVPEREASGPTGRPYVLFVGRLETRKNLAHVARAVADVPGLDLVLVGEPGYGYEETVKPALSILPSERLHVLKNVTAENLAHLYRGAVATLLPSWEEGFGMPILEAMVNGSPVITSDCSASAEIADGAAVLVVPSDPKPTTEVLRRLLDDSGYRQKLAELGLARAAQFRWTDYYENLVGIYHCLLES